MGNPFRGSYYAAKIIEVHASTDDGHKTCTVKYDDDDSAIETNVKHGNAKFLLGRFLCIFYFS